MAKSQFQVSLTERSSYMNVFLWLLDFVTPLNNFFQSFSILVYNNTIISLRLIIYYLIVGNSGLCLRLLSIGQYTIHLREITVKHYIDMDFVVTPDAHVIVEIIQNKFLTAFFFQS